MITLSNIFIDLRSLFLCSDICSPQSCLRSQSRALQPPTCIVTLCTEPPTPAVETAVVLPAQRCFRLGRMQTRQLGHQHQEAKNEPTKPKLMASFRWAADWYALIQLSLARLQWQRGTLTRPMTKKFQFREAKVAAHAVLIPRLSHLPTGHNSPPAFGRHLDPKWLTIADESLSAFSWEAQWESSSVLTALEEINDHDKLKPPCDGY